MGDADRRLQSSRHRDTRYSDRQPQDIECRPEDVMGKAVEALTDAVAQTSTPKDGSEPVARPSDTDLLDYTADTLLELIDLSLERNFDSLVPGLRQMHLAVMLERQQRTPPAP